jgi:CarD family transcriptional regulator
MASSAKKKVAKAVKSAKPAKPAKSIKAAKPAKPVVIAKAPAAKASATKAPAAKAHPAKPAPKALPPKPAPAAKPPVAAKPVMAAKPVPAAVAPKPSTGIKLGKPANAPALKVVKPAGKVEAPFAEGDYVVYPTHGVGRVQAIEKQSIAGIELELFVITFDRDRMTLRVPVPKARQSGLRKLSSRSVMDTALSTLKGRARVKRTMWSRRAQEYEAKINSGDPVSIAEVVRDLHRHANQPDQSYSERQIYEAALERLASELAAVDGIEREKATQKLEMLLDAA